MNRDLARSVRERADGRCEYCRLPQFVLPLPFQIDHIVAEQHAGATDLSSLALACPHCNRYKGPNIAGRDPDSGELVRLFHPRNDLWTDHFEFQGALILGKTPIGRATIQVLAMNAEEALDFAISSFRRVRCERRRCSRSARIVSAFGFERFCGAVLITRGRQSQHCSHPTCVRQRREHSGQSRPKRRSLRGERRAVPSPVEHCGKHGVRDLILAVKQR